MPTYQYSAVTLTGEKKSGTMEADDASKLADKLRGDNLYLADYSIKAEKGKGFSLKKKELKPMELADFCRQIGTMLGSGVTLIRSVSIIMNRDNIDPHVKETYANLYTSLKQGLALSEAMEDNAGVFPPLLVNMFKAGEASGTLDQTCMKMAEHYEKEDRLNSQIKSALMYPKILGVIMIAVVCVLFLGVMPQFFDLFNSMGGDLPLPTKIILAITTFMQNYWYIVVLVVVFFVILHKTLMKQKSYRINRDRRKIHMKKIGPIMKTIYTARFARTVSSLYASGIALVDCLAIAKDTIGNEYIASQFDDVVRDVRNGMTVSEAISHVDGFDSKLSASIMIGEETGKLDEMLVTTADSFDYESEQATGRLTALIEPVMLVIMAVLVGFIVVSVILPIYSMYDTIGAANDV